MDENPLVTIPLALVALTAIPLLVLAAIAAERRASGLATHRAVGVALLLLATLVLGAFLIALVAARAA